jgi:hypothetical protein
VEFLALDFDFVDVFGEYSFPSKSGSPQSHRGHREGNLVFVYREIPIDENNLSNETLNRGVLYRTIPEDLDAVRAFVHDSSIVRGVRTEYFCLSVSPDKQKVFSASSEPQWLKSVFGQA